MHQQAAAPSRILKSIIKTWVHYEVVNCNQRVLRMAPGSSDEKWEVYHAKILEIHLEEMTERVCQAQVKEDRIIQWQDLEGMY